MSRTVLLAWIGATLIGCGGSDPAPTPTPSAPTSVITVPAPDTSGMEIAVRERLEGARLAVERQGHSAEAWGRYGKVLHAQALHEPAIAAYRQARSLQPRNERWIYFLGDALAIEGSDPSAAVEAFEAFLALRPGYAPGHLRLGQTLATTGDHAGAEASFREALRLRPDLAPARLGLGQSLLAQGHLAEAVSTLELAAQELPESPAVHSARSRAYRRLDERDKAAAAAERSRAVAGVHFYEDPLLAEVEREALSSTLLLARAHDSLRAGLPRSARDDLRRVVIERPDDPDVHQLLGAVHADLGDLVAAADALERALELDPDRHELVLQLTLLHLEANQPRAAWETVQKALVRDPENRELRSLKARADLAGGRLQRAIDEFSELAMTGDLEPWAHDQWGTALAQSGRFAEALAQFERALQTDPNNTQTLFHRGLALEGLRRPDAAIETYRYALTIEESPLIRARLTDLLSP